MTAATPEPQRPPDRGTRASALRPRVREMARQFASEREAARQIGVSQSTLHKFLVGGNPSRHTLDKYEEWLRRSTDTNDSTEVSEVERSGTETLPDDGLLEGLGRMVEDDAADANSSRR